tara:strand:- start:44 stop:409 length:366 start_codon:yes stop_codon:yes gene_type:complete
MMGETSNKVRITERENIFCLSFLCELDASTIAELRQALQDINEINQPNILVDLSSVPFVDSHGVGFFASLLKCAHSKGGILAFSGVQEQPKSVLDMVGFNDELVKFFDDSLAALDVLDTRH